jgi:hypothetical protein
MNNSEIFPVLNFVETELTAPQPHVKTVAEKIVEVAKGELGVCEIPKGSNRGKDVEKYLKSVGLGGGYSWCMAFAKWCVDQACLDMGGKNPMVVTGGVLNQWNRIGKSYKFNKPKAGDIFIMDFGGGLGHTGIVESVEGNVVNTIEGNSNDNGSREGDKVCRRHRGADKMKGFIRIS